MTALVLGEIANLPCDATVNRERIARAAAPSLVETLREVQDAQLLSRLVTLLHDVPAVPRIDVQVGEYELSLYREQERLQGAFSSQGDSLFTYVIGGEHIMNMFPYRN